MENCKSALSEKMHIDLCAVVRYLGLRLFNTQALYLIGHPLPLHRDKDGVQWLSIFTVIVASSVGITFWGPRYKNGNQMLRDYWTKCIVAFWGIIMCFWSVKLCVGFPVLCSLWEGMGAVPEWLELWSWHLRLIIKCIILYIPWISPHSAADYLRTLSVRASSLLLR